MGRITKPDRLTSFLNSDVIDELHKRIDTDEQIHDIMRDFGHCNHLQKDFLYYYIKRIRFPSKSYRPMGVKGAYWDKEEDMEIPEYTWDDLSDAEKEFYGKREQEMDK